MRRIYKFTKDVGLLFDLSGIIVATEDQIKEVVGKKLKLDEIFEDEIIYSRTKLSKVILEEKDFEDLEFTSMKLLSKNSDDVTEIYTKNNNSCNLLDLIVMSMAGEDIGDILNKEKFKIIIPDGETDLLKHEYSTIRGFNPIIKLKEQSN